MPDIRLVSKDLCRAYKLGFYQPAYRTSAKEIYFVGYAKDTRERAHGVAQDAAAQVKGSVPMVFDHIGNNILNEKGELPKKKL